MAQPCDLLTGAASPMKGERELRPLAAKIGVSVVVPAYNAEATLADALKSLYAQTFQNWEAIVVDDGSTDLTAHVAQEFVERDNRFRLVRRVNGGESAARNTGVALARCDWLLFLDADDWIAPIHLEHLTRALVSDPALDAVHCDYARVALDGAHVIEPYAPPAGDMFATLARRAAFPVHTCLVRRSLVEAVGRFDPSLRKSADWDLWQRIARMGAHFGHVGEVLAYYRMQPNSSSLDAQQLLADGLRVLRQGHSPDPRVRNPHPDHADGLPADQMQCQQFYLLSWCAGLLLGSGQDARPLLKLISDNRCRQLYADAIAKCVFEAAPLPTCQAPPAWEELWGRIKRPAEEFFMALEMQSTTPHLASQALRDLKRMILRQAPSWKPLVDEYEQTISRQQLQIEQGEKSRARLEEEHHHAMQMASDHGQSLAERQRQIDQRERSQAALENEVDRWQRTAAEREQSIAKQRHLIESMERRQVELTNELHHSKLLVADRERHIESQRTSLDDLRAQEAHRQARLSDLREKVKLLLAERDTLLHAPEQRLGDLLLNRLRLRKPLERAWSLSAAARHTLIVARLAMDRRLRRSQKQIRIVVSACCKFPIYSQTFVYQELCQLVRSGFALRLIYSKLDRRDHLQSQFSRLWRLKRRLFLNRKTHENDFARYQRRMPEQVESLVDKLCEASGLSRQALVSHDNFLEAFSFTRMVEAYRPHYLHSYFFYDRSLMVLVASYLLGIPRGVSCYADHALKDYELKVVPLHLELCDIVIATSQRIKHELLALAPHCDPTRILVKPNGIDAERFPIVQRDEPAEGTPFRIVTVCRIDPKKGLLELVEAVDLLRRRGLRVEAHIVGAVDEWSEASRDYKRKLDQRISELELWGTVHLEGRQNLDGILRFLGSSQLFVAPFVETQSGDKDGVPTALLEGMATGLPAVAADAGSISEAVDDDRDGILVPQRDPLALANAVEILLRDPGRRRQMGAHAAEKVRRQYDANTCEQSFHERVRGIVERRLR